MKPTYEQLQSQLATQTERVKYQDAEIAELKNRAYPLQLHIKELESRICLLENVLKAVQKDMNTGDGWIEYETTIKVDQALNQKESK